MYYIILNKSYLTSIYSTDKNNFKRKKRLTERLEKRSNSMLITFPQVTTNKHFVALEEAQYWRLIRLQMSTLNDDLGDINETIITIIM